MECTGCGRNYLSGWTGQFQGEKKLKKNWKHGPWSCWSIKEDLEYGMLFFLSFRLAQQHQCLGNASLWLDLLIEGKKKSKLLFCLFIFTQTHPSESLPGTKDHLKFTINGHLYTQSGVCNSTNLLIIWNKYCKIMVQSQGTYAALSMRGKDHTERRLVWPWQWMSGGLSRQKK